MGQLGFFDADKRLAALLRRAIRWKRLTAGAVGEFPRRH